jgi:hypothetical protein
MLVVESEELTLWPDQLGLDLVPGRAPVEMLVVKKSK